MATRYCLTLGTTRLRLEFDGLIVAVLRRGLALALQYIAHLLFPSLPIFT